MSEFEKAITANLADAVATGIETVLGAVLQKFTGISLEGKIPERIRLDLAKVSNRFVVGTDNDGWHHVGHCARCGSPYFVHKTRLADGAPTLKRFCNCYERT